MDYSDKYFTWKIHKFSPKNESNIVGEFFLSKLRTGNIVWSCVINLFHSRKFILTTTGI